MYKTHISKNLVWQGIYEVFSVVLGFSFYIILARMLGKVGLGTYSYLFSLLAIPALAIDMGISSFFLRKWSTDTSALRRDIQTVLGTKLILLAPMSIVLFFYVLLFERNIPIMNFFLVYLFTVLDIFMQIPTTYVKSQNAFRKNTAFIALERGISMGGGIVALLLGFPLTSVLLMAVVAKIAAVFFAFAKTRIFSRPEFSMERMQRVLVNSIPLFLMTIFSYLYFKIDIIVIRHMLGLEAVGKYTAGYRILETLIIIPGLLSASLAPVITALYQKNNIRALQEILQTVLQYLCIFSFFVSLFFVGYAQQILDFLYGESFVIAYQSFRVLGATLPFLFVNAIFALYLYAHHREKILIKNYLVLAVLNIGLNILLIPSFNIVGSALATFFCEAMMFFSLKKNLSLQIHLAALAKIFLTAIVVSIGLFFASLRLFPALFLFGTLYLAMLYAWKVFRFKLLADTISLAFKNKQR